MSSNPSYQQLGFEAMNACFFGGGSSMIGSEAAPFFYPSTALDASFFSGDPVAFGGGADVAAHFMASNNAMVTSPANQLVWAAAAPSPASMSTEEMNDDAYAVVPGESCSTVHSLLPPAAAATSPEFFQYGPSDVTIAQPSKMAKLVTGEPHCSWFYDGASAASIHDPYYLTAFTSFRDPLAAEGSGLSLRLGAQPSSVTMASLPDQSPEVSCSGLTHLSSEGFGYQQPPQTARAHAGTGLFQLPPCGDGELQDVYPHVYSRPAHFSQVLPRSGYAHIAQELLNGFAGCLLRDVTENMADDSASGVGGEASLLLRTPSSASSNRLVLPPRRAPAGRRRRREVDGGSEGEERPPEDITADGPAVQPVLRRHPDDGDQVQQHGGASRSWRHSHRRAAVRAARGLRGVPSAPEADRGADHGVRRLVAGREGAELGVVVHPEALGAAPAPARRPAVVAAPARPAGEVRGRAESLDVRELPPPVPERQREGHAGGEERAEQEPGVQLVHKRARPAVEADDRGDVRGAEEELGGQQGRASHQRRCRRRHLDVR